MGVGVGVERKKVGGREWVNPLTLLRDRSEPTDLAERQRGTH